MMSKPIVLKDHGGFVLTMPIVADGKGNDKM